MYYCIIVVPYSTNNCVCQYIHFSDQLVKKEYTFCKVNFIANLEYFLSIYIKVIINTIIRDFSKKELLPFLPIYELLYLSILMIVKIYILCERNKNQESYTAF